LVGGWRNQAVYVEDFAQIEGQFFSTLVSAEDFESDAYEVSRSSGLFSHNVYKHTEQMRVPSEIFDAEIASNTKSSFGLYEAFVYKTSAGYLVGNVICAQVEYKKQGDKISIAKTEVQ